MKLLLEKKDIPDAWNHTFHMDLFVWAKISHDIIGSLRNDSGYTELEEILIVNLVHSKKNKRSEEELSQSESYPWP